MSEHNGLFLSERFYITIKYAEHCRTNGIAPNFDHFVEWLDAEGYIVREKAKRVFQEGIFGAEI